VIFLIEYIKKNEKTILEIFFCFICCGIIGWVYETLVVLIQMGEMTDRGILFISRINDFPLVWGLPFIMIYGIGGAVLIWCFKPLAKKPVLLFITGMIVMTAFEYATAFMCETFLNQKLWDYTGHFMNLQGRICLFASIAWGILSILSVKVLGPLFHRIYNKIDRVAFIHIAIILIVAYILICYSLRSTLFPDMV